MYDVACAGAVYLDLTFAGLDRVPRPGEERWAHELLLSPGGMANTAVGLNRLGLKTAIVSPLGRDMAGQYLRALLEPGASSKCRRHGWRCATPPAQAICSPLHTSGPTSAAGHSATGCTWRRSTRRCRCAPSPPSPAPCAWPSWSPTPARAPDRHAHALSLRRRVRGYVRAGCPSSSRT